ncbi:uncharacterized protein LOC144926865 [Branchiostoma floridae x Branchiostoma belcheri]
MADKHDDKITDKKKKNKVSRALMSTQRYGGDKFKWSDGMYLQDTDYTNWGDGEPNRDGDCVTYFPSSHPELLRERWNDIDCDKAFMYICQKDAVHMTTPGPIKLTTSNLQGSGSGGVHAFMVLRAKNYLYHGIAFFIVEAKLPFDGLSASENWCRDYQNLCDNFGLRPTGCGEYHYNMGGGYEQCATEYNSDVYVNNILSCVPWGHVSTMARLAFPTAGSGSRFIGFHLCLSANCNGGIAESADAIGHTTDAMGSDGIVYAVCRGSSFEITDTVPSTSSTEPPRITPIVSPTTDVTQSLEIRLVGGDTPNKGRVEVLHNEEWGTICDDNWDLLDAEVACRQLGYLAPTEVVTSAFGAGTGTIWLDEVQCGGQETRLSDCQHPGWGVQDCGHSEDVGIICGAYDILDCTFEDGFCLWVQSPLDDFEWERKQGATSSTDTGPSFDHTLESISGTYVYTEATGNDLGARALLYSTFVRPSDSTMCLTFWYHMYGSSMGTLNMYIEMDETLPSVPMWTKSGDQGDEWHMVELQIDVVAEYRVVFEGIIGTSFYSDIALDDITFVPGLCSSLIPACHPLGVETGAIPDQDITAKSFSQSSQTTGTFPYNGRLHGGSAWVAGTVESGEWLQVIVGENRYISGVVTQGHATKLQWVTSYKLKFTTGAGDWVFYKINGIEKVFAGNTDNTTPVTNLLYSPVAASGVRFRILTCYNAIAMRVEVLGCDRWYVPSPWSECSTSVGDGSQSRDLLCNPADSDTACPATVEQSEIQMCQPVNGSWSPWGLWSSCDVTCGDGLQMRNRSCDSPAPANGGLYCSGNDTDFQLCTTAPCPVNGNWSQWSSWSTCDVTCGFGSQWRNRSCDNPPPQHGGTNCTGSSVDLQICEGPPCPINGNWSQWSSWSTCDVTCGFGSQWRNRSCDNPPPQHGGDNCTGSSADLQTCAVPPCAVNGNWSQWSSWSTCDVTCGFGSQARNRSCDNPPPQHGGTNCTGSSADLQICEGPPCAVNGNWSQWSSWSTCDVTCGFGSQWRNRSCDNPPPQHGGDNCTGSSMEVQTCEETPCAVDGNWSVWSSWATCDVSCGVGYKTRNRSCNNPAPLYGGADCNGTSNDIQLCDSLPLCKVDGSWSQWEAWSNCTVTCAGGTRTRSRTCDQPPPQNGGRRCNGGSTESETCTGQVDPSCYVPSVISDAKPDHGDNNTVTASTVDVTFSDQMFSLDLGLITHFTVIVAEDGAGLNDTAETGLILNAQMYSWYDVQGLSPVPPYQVSALAPYPFTSSRRKKRNTGTQELTFTIGDENCTDAIVTLYCNGPLKLATTYRAKMRVFTPNGYYADSYYSDPVSTLASSWSEWAAWSVCTPSCGAGNQTRNRTCDTAPGNNGTAGVANCTGDSFQTRACMDIGQCPVDGVWSPWSLWTTCMTVCGLGNQTRNRTCSQPLYGGANCTGEEDETRACTGPLEPHCTSTADPSASTVPVTTPSPDPLAPSDGGTMEEFSRWETGEALPEDYDAEASPVDMSKGEPLPTSSGVMLENIGWLSEETMDFNITATFTVAWTDDRLANLGGSGWIPVPSHVLWLPSVQFGRTVKARWPVTTSSEVASVGNEDSGPGSGTVSTWLSPEGQLSHRLKKKLRVSCLMDLRNYPFDSQTCTIQLHGYGGIAFQVFVTEGGKQPLVLDLTDIDSQFFVEKTELLAIVGSFRREGSGCPYFHQKCDLSADADYCPTLRFCDVSEPACKKCSMYSGTCQVMPTTCNGSQAGSPDTFSTLEAKVHFKRRLPYYVLRVFTPTATVVAVSWMSFWVHYSETSARVALGCTTFLMLVRLGSQIEKMPHISYIRAIDLWYVFCLAFAFMVIVEYAVVHHLHNPQNKKVKQKEKKERKTVPSPRKSQEDEPVAVSPRTRFAQAVKQVRARPPSAGRSRVSPDPGAHAKSSGKPVKAKPSGWELIIPPTSRHASSKPAGRQDSTRRQGDGGSTLVQGADANTTYHVMQGQTTRKRRRYRGTQGEQGDLATTTSPTQKTQHQAKGPTQDKPSTFSGSAAPPESIPEEPPAAANEQKKAEKNPDIVYKKPCNIDVWSRVIFPVGFLLFSIVYWAYYLNN